VEAHHDLRVVLLGADHQREAGQRDHLLAPRAHLFGGVRLRTLLGDVGLEVLLEVARLQIHLVIVVDEPALGAAAAPIATAASAVAAAPPPSPSPSPSATAAAGRTLAAAGDGRAARRRGWRRLGGRGDGGLVDLGLDDHAFDAAQEAALL